MTPTLLELAVAIIVIVMAWQIGLLVAPSVLRWFRSLGQDIEEATDEALVDLQEMPLSPQHKEEHTNGTRR